VITCREATPADAAWIAPQLRAADALEVRRLGQEPAALLEQNIRDAQMAGVFLADGVPLCAFGVIRPSLLTPRVGCPWMLGTPLLDRYARDMLRETRAWVDEWRKDYDALYAWVDAEYPAAIRWMHWLGFETMGFDLMGPDCARFWRMAWER
jgi:hypothetical protein